MPGIAQKIYSSSGSDESKGTISGFNNSLIGNAAVPFHSSNGSSISKNEFWSRHGDDLSYSQLQKFWSELTPQARQNLLKIDKQTLFEHARKNMYCSRCNGLLLEGFLQILMCGKSPLPDPSAGHCSLGSSESHNLSELFCLHNCPDDAKDPSIHPWGGLTTTRDGSLTLLDCYLHSKSLKALQNVFDSACEREKDREQLYPDACGGGKRGWISQGNARYGKGHGTRETCALHTSKPSVETLVDFWSALGEETRQSLLRMKEEDFIERLMYRFDCKRFCRDCRRNVIREFKELKELKRLRRVTRCTSWFCVADTAFEYEVSHDTVHADWHQTFFETFGTYHHFEWAIGTGEGKSDILEFENVGLSRRVQANGLDLGSLSSCHITLRAWKVDGRCNEWCVKAHALRGQQCVHCRLVVGDGFVAITKGESIARLFEHAEEAEEEEDDDSVDKDESDLDGECSRPQKHAKSPELAREFLLDAATIIFKEQVEKAHREGTTRQNAHSIFVCLALKLLEERVHIACKEIVTLEKQIKLLEEEENEKREEVERKERRKMKEREKKLRRKERLKGRESKCAESNLNCVDSDDLKVETEDCFGEVIDAAVHVETDEVSLSQHSDYSISNVESISEVIPEEESGNWNGSFQFDDSKYSHTMQNFGRNSSQDLNLKSADRRKVASLSETRTFCRHDSRYHADGAESTPGNNVTKQVRGIALKSEMKNGIGKLNGKFQRSRYDSQACSCNHHHHEYRLRQEYNPRTDPKYGNKLETTDFSKSYYRGNRSQLVYRRENNGQVKCKMIGTSHNAKKVWEPLDSWKKCIRSNSDSDFTLRSTPKIEASESSSTSSDEVVDVSVQTSHMNNDMKHLSSPILNDSSNVDSEYHTIEMFKNFSKEGLTRKVESCPSTRSSVGTPDASVSASSNSDNCSSCLSEGDSNASLSPQNMESASTSDSEESGQILDGRTLEHSVENGSIAAARCLEERKVHNLEKESSSSAAGILAKSTSHCENGNEDARFRARTQSILPQMQNPSMNLPIFHAPLMGYYHQAQAPGTWSTGAAAGGMVQPIPISNAYVFPGAYGYGNSQFMQYRPLQPLVPAMFSHPPQIPVFRPVHHVNGVSIKDHPINVVSNLSAVKHQQHVMQQTASIDQHLEAAPRVEENRKDESCFSLFHFGGPVALSTGTKADISSSLEGKKESSCVESRSCSEKKDCSIEDYMPCDANNGIKFSIF